MSVGIYHATWATPQSAASPAAGAGSPALGAVVSSVASTAGSLLGAIATPALEHAGQGIRAHNPVWIPSPGDLLQLLSRRFISPALGAELLAWHGIDIDGRGNQTGGQARTKAWQQVREMQYWRPSAETAIQLYLRGRISQKKAIEWVENAGGKYADFFDSPSIWRTSITPPELFILRNRGLITEAQFSELLQASIGEIGMGRGEYAMLRDNIPGPADLVRFVVREAFNDVLSGQLGLDEEYQPDGEFAWWMSRQGMGTVRAYGDDQAGRQMDVPRLYWRSHWMLPSPTQAYSFLHRLRPSGGANNGPRDPTGPDRGAPPEVFTSGDLSNLLKANDYPRKWRSQLAAVSYLVPGRIDVRRLYGRGIFGRPEPLRQGQVSWGAAENELIERYQDMGYARENARLLAEYTALEYWRAKARQATDIATTAIRDGWMIGALQEEQAKGLLLQQDWTREQADAALGSWAVLRQIRRVKAVQRSIHSSYLRGALSTPEMEGQLLQAGVDIDAIPGISATWQAELTGQRRELSASKVIDAVVRGIITPQEGARRLANLSFTEGAIAVMLAAAAQDIARNIERQRLSEIRSQKARAREELALAREAAKNAERLRKAAIGRATKADILRWYDRGYIGEEEALNRLVALGYTDIDAARLTQEVEDDEEAESE
jgi:hypothetical protein